MIENAWTNVVEWFLNGEPNFTYSRGFLPLFASYEIPQPYIIKIKERDLWNIKYCSPNHRIGNWLFTQNRNGERDTLTLNLGDKGIWVWLLPEQLDHATCGKIVEAKWPD